MSKLENRKFTNWAGVCAVLIVAVITGCVQVVYGAETTTTDYCSQRNVIELDRDAGRISSQDVSLEADGFQCQMWRIQATANSTITISFSKLLVDEVLLRDNCNSVSRVTLGPEPVTSLCTSKGSYVYHSQRDHVWIKLYRYQNQLFPPVFELDYVSSPMENCEATCHSGQCIYRKWICNGIPECSDSSDERECYKLGMTSEKAGAVETTAAAGKATCGFGEIYCYSTTWRQYMCLHNVHKCDGIVDCRGGEDEDHALCGDEVCNRVLEEPVGWFASPNFPLPYPSNVHCSWVIHQLGTSSSFTIQLRVIKFHLEAEEGTDVLKIYDGADSTYNLIGAYYGTEWPPHVIESNSNWMNVVFESDAYRQYSGFNFTYQIKGECLPHQVKCDAEKDCYNHEAKCDGVWDCAVHGSDEMGCGGCSPGDYSCGKSTTQCYHLQERCNGISRCSNSADENNCTYMQCGSHNGTFLCANKRCIYESWTCDGRDDCGDNSDEKRCSGSTKRVIIATISGAMVCALMLVILLGCSCKLYSLRTAERHGGPRHETPMTRLYAEFLRRRAPPPYHEAMLTSRNFDEVQQEYLERMRNSARRVRRNRRRSRNNNNNQGQGQSHALEGAMAVIPSPSTDVCGNSSTPTDNTLPNAQASQLTSILEETDNTGDSIADTEPTTDDTVISDSETESADTDSNHENQDEGQSEVQQNIDIDVDNILESESLSALWARDIIRDNDSSDDGCILEDNVSILNDIGTGQGHCDTGSVETASASIDLIEMPEIQTSSTFPKDSDIENESDDSIEEFENSRNSTPKPESYHGTPLISDAQSSPLRRDRSQDSLNSTGSEYLSETDVPSVSGYTTLTVDESEVV